MRSDQASIGLATRYSPGRKPKQRGWWRLEVP